MQQHPDMGMKRLIETLSGKPSMNWSYGDTGFYSGQTSYLNMKVLTFAKYERGKEKITS